MTNENAELKLKKAHVRLMKSRLTAPFIGAFMLGESTIDEKFPTACTDGVNKIYGRGWVDAQDMPKMCGGVLHENLHVFLKHIPRHLDLMREDRQLANAAMDYVVNDLIVLTGEQDSQLVQLPDGGLHDIKFRNWSVREVYNFLKRGQGNQGQQESKPTKIKITIGPGKGKNGSGQVDGVRIGGREYKLEGHDEHDDNVLADATPQQVQEVLAKISEAIHQGGLLAGRMGMEIPRALRDAMEPEVDWADETKEFVTAATKGNDEYTWRKYNKHRMADDYFLPSTESETIGEVIVAIDTSGSIGQEQLDEFAGEIAGICELSKPERVRVLWWDTVVHGEQLFNPDNYQNIRKLLKPMGGGGTCVSSVSRYLSGRKIEADCVIVFTDGYVESDIDWRIKTPTLWLVTQCESFRPPAGKMVKFRSKR
jgi:predicted metal-dependent peptidase